MKIKINTKYNREHNLDREEYPNAKSEVDRTGYQSLETRVKQLQSAGLSLKVAKDSLRYDTMSDHERDLQIIAPPFRGLSPDLADIHSIHQENAQRMTELKTRIKADQLLREEEQKKLNLPEQEDNKEESDTDLQKTKNAPKSKKDEASAE